MRMGWLFRRGSRSPWACGSAGRVRALLSGVALSLLLVGARTASADQQPLWEIGLGGGALQVPDYRGSDRSRVYPYPFVLPYYRGRVLQSDERGMRGLFFESDRVKLDVSLDGSVPVASGDNPARRGMDDLGPTIQIGPMLRVLLWGREQGPQQSLSLNLPLRAAFAFDSGVEHIGYTAYPNLSYRRDLPLLSGQPWKLTLTAGAMWGSEQYHDYFYQVDAAEATPGRPAYDASSGYAGGRLMATLYRREPRRLWSFYLLYDSVRGAVFDDSPLVESEGGFTVGFLVAWFPFRSSQSVERGGWDW